MGDQRQHRGQHPQDARLFETRYHMRLRDAVRDYSWLLGRNYAAKSALELVGNRYQLAKRQRLAVMRCTCSDAARERRQQHEVLPAVVAGQTLLLDGFNALTTVETAISGGLVLPGRDGCYRDIASMHGTFRRVEETLPSLALIGDALNTLNVATTTWYCDSPVSNSGRLKELMLGMAHERVWNWNVELVLNPDPVLAAASEIIATADGVILDACQRWFNLARWAIISLVPNALIVDLVS